MRDAMLVAAGGATGALARYLIGLAFVSRTSGTLPWHTFAINVSGALLLGLLMGVALRSGEAAEPWLLLLGTGLLGGFTTFSTLAFEGVSLFESGRGATAMLYAFGSVAVGLLAAWVGLATTRAF